MPQHEELQIKNYVVKLEIHVLESHVQTMGIF